MKSKPFFLSFSFFRKVCIGVVFFNTLYLYYWYLFSLLGVWLGILWKRPLGIVFLLFIIFFFHFYLFIIYTHQGKNIVTMFLLLSFFLYLFTFAYLNEFVIIFTHDGKNVATICYFFFFLSIFFFFYFYLSFIRITERK